MGKHRVILSGGVHVQNSRAIGFFEKNKFQLLTTIFLSHDGYECRDLIFTGQKKAHPSFIIHFGEMLIRFRPLLPDDTLQLTRFLEDLSEQSRQFFVHPSYDLKMARQLCSYINQYDQLRLVAVLDDGSIVALFELSLTIMNDERNRFLQKYGIVLDEKIDGRFGPCISDKYQNRHLGSWLFEKTIKIVRQLNKQRLILWGGVFSTNTRAIRFYEKNGFEVFKDAYQNGEGLECRDGIYHMIE